MIDVFSYTQGNPLGFPSWQYPPGSFPGLQVNQPSFHGWQYTPGLVEQYHTGAPTLLACLHFAGHAFLLSALIAAGMIDARHRIIPAQITYVSTLVGLVCSVAFAWPWPSNDFAPNGFDGLLRSNSWNHPELLNRFHTGFTLWPFWGPLPSWAPPGSWILGLLNGLIGAAAGMIMGRGIRAIFELGLGQEALGLGDADLLMMAGSFLGWQPIVLALPVGAVLTLLVVLPLRIYGMITGRKSTRQIPFGPGLAGGVVVCWWSWPWLGPMMQPICFDWVAIIFVLMIVGGGLLVAGLFLRRERPEAASAPATPGN